ncbi:MAG: hypothetical protein JWM81_579 [Candidatus Saccharibacteria bacterium]|nr:hypothetical protein [Candidatus Saccharibacteria bacterium]
MAEKKIPISASPQDEDLEQRVEILMGAPLAPKANPAAEKPSDAEPKIDVSKYAPAAQLVPLSSAQPQTAPVLPKTRTKIAINTIDDNPEVAEPAAVEVPPVPLPEPLPEPKAVAPISVSEAVDEQPPTVGDALQARAADLPIDEPLTIDDPKTDAAIDDIAEHDSDDLLAAEDEAITPLVVGKKAKAKHPRRRLLLVLVLLIAALAAVFGIPQSRYKVLGLALKRTVQVTVLDSTTKLPVTDAKLSIGTSSGTTNSRGTATFKAPVGPHTLTLSKQYYRAANQQAFVSITKSKNITVSLVATGRQVPIKVINKLTGQPIANAEISVLNTNAKTSKDGTATIVLPVSLSKRPASLTADGFNTSKVTLEVTSSLVPQNTFSITPAGKVYVLSNESGTIDVVKTNLDGTGRQTVLKGTGKEDSASTVLLATRDWRYVVLKAQRDKAQASMYLIDTTNDHLTEFDSGDASFTPIGWYGHYFMYDVVRNGVSTSQNGHEVLKSYDAERAQLNQLDQSQAEDSGNGSYAYQGFYNFYILNNLLVYNSQWYSSGGASLVGKTSSIRGVQPTGQAKKDYQTLDANGMGYIQAALVSPQEIYYAAYNYNDSKTVFLDYQNQAAKISTEITQASFNKTYPVYLASPSGKKVFWSEQRDGKPTPILGGANAESPQQQTNLIGYSAYGWFSDDYLLVTKGGSELYIVAAAGGKAPIKLTDYYKAAQGYGGL